MSERTLTLALMDPPYESANSTTALRIISAALAKGINVNVFAYEGAVCLPLQDQAPHANPVKGTTLEEEDHPTTRAFVSSLLAIGKDKLKWVKKGSVRVIGTFQFGAGVSRHMGIYPAELTNLELFEPTNTSTNQVKPLAK